MNFPQMADCFFFFVFFFRCVLDHHLMEYQAARERERERERQRETERERERGAKWHQYLCSTDCIGHASAAVS